MHAAFHDRTEVRTFRTRWGHRIVLYLLPKYAPRTNLIARVWWHLHEEITRNHLCQTSEELIHLTLKWIGSKKTFAIETSTSLKRRPPKAFLIFWEYLDSLRRPRPEAYIFAGRFGIFHMDWDRACKQ